MEENTSTFTRQKKWSYFADLVFQKAWAGLRAEASRGYLGVLWWVLEPLMYMVVFYIVFAHLFHRGDENFIAFLLTGLIVWKWFHGTINTGSSSLIVNVGLMNQVYLPKIVFPITAVAITTFKFLIILILLIVFLPFTSAKPSLSWIFLPVLVLTQFFLILSITSLISAIMPFFPDLRFILDNVLMMFLFLSGIFFDISKLSESAQYYLMFNPMAEVISMYRKLLLNGLSPDWQQLLFVLLFSFVVWVLAILIFHRFDRIYPKIIY